MAIAKRKKRFYEVNMPLIRKETQLQAFEPKDLVGRNIKYDLNVTLLTNAPVISAGVIIANII